MAPKGQQRFSNRALRKQQTGIVDSGASDLYLVRDAPLDGFNPNSPKVRVETATGQVQQSSGTAKLALTNLPYEYTKTGKVIPSFKHTLLGLGIIFDTDCKVVFTKGAVLIYDTVCTPIITI